MKMKKKYRYSSVIVGIGNPALFLICVIFLYFFGNNQGPIRPELLPLFFYCLLSFAPAIAGVLFALVELITKKSLKMACIGLSLNLTYLISSG
jgi:hypothetical protein